MSFEVAAYGPIFAELLNADRLRPLDKGSPDTAFRGRLQAVSADDAFAHARIVDRDAARCCLSGVWLVYDFLDDSHTLSQDIATTEGSFWHGIMHRREGDFSNAKYWFRKVGEHSVYDQLADEPLCESAGWDPYEFVDACQAALRVGGAEEDRCRQLQQREWEFLFDFCYRQAVGE